VSLASASSTEPFCTVIKEVPILKIHRYAAMSAGLLVLLAIALPAQADLPAAVSEPQPAAAPDAAPMVGLADATPAAGLADAAQPAPAAKELPAPAAAKTRSAQSATLETVTVTAQKRSEDLKEVPISISVLSGDDIAAQRIGTFDDISRAVPGISFNSVGATAGLTNVVIRGVSSTAGSATVGTYLDDVSITVKNFYDGNALPRLYDLQRIEVLRGPQGTLWGASSEGGTIRYISEPPNLQEASSEVTGDTSRTQHGGANFMSSAVINAPITPGVSAVRASIGYVQDSGYIDHYNLAGVKDHAGVNGENTFTLHVLGKIAPDGELSISPALFYQRNRFQDNAASYVARQPAVFDPANPVLVPSLGLWQQNKQVPEYGEDSMFLPSLTLNRTLGQANFTSVTGYFLRRFHRQEDGTYYNSATFATSPTLPGLDALYPGFQSLNDTQIATLPSFVESGTRYEQFSQEFRLASSESDHAKQPLRWVTGLYFAHQTIHNTNFQRIPGINTTFARIYGYSMDDPTQSLVKQTFDPGNTVSALFPRDIDEFDDRTYHEKQYAVFGQLDYDFAPAWHAGVGLRYLTAKEDFLSTEIGFFQIGNISPYTQSASFNAFTPKFTVGYDVSEAAKVYASASKGFRLGGPTGPIVFGPTSVCNSDFNAIGQTSQPTKFGSDSLWTYELGSKNAFANGRASIDFAAFYTQWKDIQQQIYLPTCGYYFTTNAGDAKIVGGEVEAYIKPLPELKLGLTGSVNHTEITKTNNPLTVPLGAHLIDVPEATYTAMAVFTRPWDEDYVFHARADYAWTGHANGSYKVGNSNFDNPSYGVLNLSFGISGSKYDLEVYAKNALADKTIIQSPQINTVVEGYTVRPRTIGLTARARF
jgi:outer membrane receptor protein involved in Fe transport